MKPLFFVIFSLGIIAIVLTAVLLTAYPLKYKKHINAAADLYDVDPVLIASVINAESSFRRGAVSNKGAVGLMQIMPATGQWCAKKMNIEFNEETLQDPRTNILIGTFYLSYLQEKFRDERTALMAYNAGEGKVTAWLAKIDQPALLTCPYPETNKYVDEVLNGLKFYKLRF